MSEQIKDGGPAMPFEDGMFVGGKRVNGSIGVTMRDWFAAKALTGLLSLEANPRFGETCEPFLHYNDEHVAYMAKNAYRLADAMLTYREQP